ncbi:hypothetical protein D3C81_2157940 [compost metagenome]
MTLAFTLSAAPRRFTNITSSMKPSAPNVIQVLSASMPKAANRLAAKACDAVAADVSPELITVKQTMKVRKCTPKALCT